jgi:hypothetical protein
MASPPDTPTAGTPPRNPGRAFTIAAFSLAGLGLAMFPLGGLVGAICALLARSRGDQPLALLALAASVVSFIASFFVAAWVLG